ncbi:hypothetical protein, partial [Deinococcus sp. DB0503]|uniref:hypothetical protein n=1 Tax=Deinococcus sp. DB0503 TaxID=2479203 RepID=UPI0018DEEFA3
PDAAVIPFTQGAGDLGRPPQRRVGETHAAFFREVDRWSAVGTRDVLQALGVEETRCLVQERYLLHFPSLIGGVMVLGPAAYQVIAPQERRWIRSSTEATNQAYVREGIKRLLAAGYAYDLPEAYGRHWMDAPDGTRCLVLGKCIGNGYSPRAIRGLLSQKRSHLLAQHARLLVVTPTLVRLSRLAGAHPHLVRLYRLPLSDVQIGPHATPPVHVQDLHPRGAEGFRQAT